MKYITPLLVFFIAFILIQGCEKKQEKSDSQPSSDEQTAEVQFSDEQTVTEKAVLETKEGLPENFPKEIPIPEKAKKIKYIDNNTGKIVICETEVGVKEVINFYKENMKKNGFELIKNDNLIDKDEIYNADWKKDNKNVNVAITFQNNTTSVVISY